jgi:voltage-gated potassium channel
VVVLLCASAIGVAGYLIAGWRLLDALYMVVITIFGVGYGEVRAMESDNLRIFTIGLIISGCSALVYIMGGMFQLITEGELNRALGRRRMTKEIDALEGHVIVCGFGRIGRVLAESFRRARVPFVVIDQDARRVEDAAGFGVLVFEGDATQEQTLEAAGITRARALATVLPNDALNVFITLTARTLAPKVTIIARGEDPRTERKLIAAGADRVVLPAAIGADQIAHLLTYPLLNDLFTEDSLSSLSQMFGVLGAGFEVMRIPESSKMLGQCVRDLESVAQGGYMVVALRRAAGALLKAPPEDLPLEVGDEVLLMGRAARLPGVAQAVAKRSLRDLQYRRGARS